MKKLLTLIVTISIVFITKSQNSFPGNGNAGVGTNSPQHEFDVNGDIKASGKLLAGSTWTIDGPNGTMKNNAWANAVNRILQADVNGSIIPLSPGTSTQVLYGNGVWGALPQGATSWSVAGNNLFNTNAGYVGINNSSPAYALDVTGDARISNNLYVGGGIVIADKLHAQTSLTTGVITATTINMASGGSIVGNTTINGDLTMSATSTVNTNVLNSSGDISGGSKLTVAGNVEFNGDLKMTSFAGLNGGSLRVTNLGAIVKGPPTLNCIPESPQWSFGGDNFIPFSLTVPPLPMEPSVGTCNNYDFALKANNTIRQTIKTDGKIGFGTQSPLTEFHFDNGKVGIGAGPFASPDKSLTVNGDVCFANYGSAGNPNANNGFSAFEIVGGDKVPTKRGVSVEEDPDGDMSFFISKTQNGQGPYASAFRFKHGILPGGGPAPNATSAPDIMVVNNSGQFTLTPSFYYLANVFSINNTSLPPASGQNIFSVRADGMVTISHSLVPNPSEDVFRIVDLTNNNGTSPLSTNFKIKKNGNVYCREVWVQLTAFPDYVFAKDYKLPELGQLKKYIAENKHLPNVPSAKDVITNGLSIGEMSKLQMEKIEELTLYVIQLKEEIEAIKNEAASAKKNK